MTVDRLRLAALLFLVCLGASCAPRALTKDLPSLERRWPVTEQVLRHKVSLEIPGQPRVSFDGLVRYGPGPELRVVCLGVLGMTLCDMTITPGSRKTHFLHPSLSRIPDVEAQIALCLRGVWFASLASETRGEDSAREIYAGTVLEHRIADGRHTVTAQGPKAFWTVTFAAGSFPPRDMTFSCERPAYAVQIRFIGQQRKEGEAP